jgi:adenylosuccinate synthase
MVEGKESAQMPYQLTGASVDPVYRAFKGWDRAVADCRSVDTLPVAFQEYIGFVRDYLGVDIRYISNGPGREQILHQTENAAV